MLSFDESTLSEAERLLLGSWELYSLELLAIGAGSFTILAVGLSAGAVAAFRVGAKENPEILQASSLQDADTPPTPKGGVTIEHEHRRSGRFIAEKKRLVWIGCGVPALSLLILLLHLQDEPVMAFILVGFLMSMPFGISLYLLGDARHSRAWITERSLVLMTRREQVAMEYQGGVVARRHRNDCPSPPGRQDPESRDQEKRRKRRRRRLRGYE